MMRTAVPEQQKPDAIVFSRAVAEQKGTPVYQLLMKYRVKTKTKSQRYRGGYF
ncbi:hypothetical protein ACVVIH_01015 [Chryseobacterium arthrosphaerae]|uniref:hypothetical protein n=1 Tax=Chryseobacterium arthrosphaerae TaxID=651561 RepID=UPI001BB0171F|nr:hypothetical protein [Chryseobacterium arthrosphaerae]QUY57035.1 hypothetical protein I2F65_06820 [Chryseobacterium arthrosphaerae]